MGVFHYVVYRKRSSLPIGRSNESQNYYANPKIVTSKKKKFKKRTGEKIEKVIAECI